MTRDIASEFVGTWQLVSYSAVASSGATFYPMGPNARGRIIYDAGGRMAVQLGDPGRAAFASGDPGAATDSEVRAAFDGYLAYFGTYTVDAGRGAVVHHLERSLESGGLGFNVLTTAGVIQVDTTNASRQAGGGTRFEAGHDPDLGKSRFVCLDGTLQVQPNAASAPLVPLGRGQFVDVTAAGAGPVGRYRFVYLPLVRR